jgi:hypothetical protein
MNTAMGVRVPKMLTRDEMREFEERSPALYKRWLKNSKKAQQLLAKEKKEEERKARQKARHPRTGTRWTEQEDQLLRSRWGEWTVRKLGKALGRTERSVGQRAKRLKLGPASKVGGRMSLREFEQFSGFSRTKIRSAAKKLGISLKRAKTSDGWHVHKGQANKLPTAYSRTMALTVSQQNRLLAYMLEHQDKIISSVRISPHQWEGRTPAQCSSCNTTERPYKARGMCDRCYDRNITRERRARAQRQKAAHDHHDDRTLP